MAFNVKNINFTLAQLLGNDKFILVSQAEKILFKNNVPTDERYSVAEVTTAESGFEKIAVKLEGKGLDVSNETLTSRNCNFDFLFVRFVGDSARFYPDFKTGEQKITAKAKAIELLSATEDDIELN